MDVFRDVLDWVTKFGLIICAFGVAMIALKNTADIKEIKKEITKLKK